MSGLDVLFSAIFSVTVAEAITNPFELIKNRYQSSNEQYRKIVKTIYLNHGIRGFFTSLKIASFTQVINSASKLAIYTEISK